MLNTTNKYFTCDKGCGLFLSLDKIKQPPPISPTSSGESQDCVSQLERELREKTQETHHLQQQLRQEREQVNRLQGEVRRKDQEVREERETVVRLQEEVRRKDQEVREERETVVRLQGEVRRKDQEVRRKDEELQQTVTRFEDQLRGQRERLVIELQHMKNESEQYQRQFREEQVQRQELAGRIEGVMALCRGETVTPQLLDLWELPREDVYISQTLLGTGGWGYVAQGTFRGEEVAVKCLHREILSPQNEGRVRREISIMAQVRHPNLLLLIGAVLTTEGAGPLIITELLDRSLRSAYQDGVLEERSKVPILRNVASALTYLHSHHTPIIHRDVSSANVLLEHTRPEIQWKAKLSDFGSANLSHLATTPFEGAAVYSAPEVSMEDRSRQTAKIDVYSFGVLVCEVALCRFPPDRLQFPSMLRDVHHATPDMFPLARDCTSHVHQDRPAMRQVLERIDQLGN